MGDVNDAVIREMTGRLAQAGCVAPREEAIALVDAAAGDIATLDGFVRRRTRGEPLAWITGTVRFCGLSIHVAPGVYVPRWQSEPLAERAAVALPPSGRAIDLGTGAGALARVLIDRRPGAAVLGTETDGVAAACARSNGVEVALGDLFDGVPDAWRGTVDVIVGVLPYVPTDELAFLPRDVQAFEPRTALDGGTDGLTVVRRAIERSPAWLKPGGRLLLEVGGEQPDALTAASLAGGFRHVEVVAGADGEPRGIEAVLR